MKIFNLMPYWYIEKKNNVILRFIDIVLAAAIGFNCILVIITFHNYDKYKNASANENNYTIKVNDINNVITNKKNELYYIKRYVHIFNRQLKGEYEFSSIDIDKSGMVFDSYEKDSVKILGQFKRLEEENGISVNNIMFEDNSNNKTHMKAVFKLK